MTKQEARKKFIERCANLAVHNMCADNDCIDCEYDVAINCIEKQIPKKARKEQRTNGFSNLQFYYVCPVCGVALNDSPYTYCEKCGQKIIKGRLE